MRASVVENTFVFTLYMAVGQSADAGRTLRSQPDNAPRDLR